MQKEKWYTFTEHALPRRNSNRWRWRRQIHSQSSQEGITCSIPANIIFIHQNDKELQHFL